MTARLNELDPQAWPADVFARIAPPHKTASTRCWYGSGRRRCPVRLPTRRKRSLGGPVRNVTRKPLSLVPPP
ncbi:transposase domain-containing protein [Bradyrhizobium sp. BRP22]|uniref:transposase domain-containing protein n=1 Tax=Bradyrhizobium sp. BRP22 TaxID=2793821 RepID=UPI001CD7882D|nr:transposase domain-containing protein [Bradyrhizobium sp. BRP22]